MMTYLLANRILEGMGGRTSMFSSNGIYLGLSTTAPSRDGTGYTEPPASNGYKRTLLGIQGQGSTHKMGTATAGGIKSIRGVMLLKVIRNEFRQILHPNAVLPMKIDGVNVPQSKRVTLLGFLGLYLLLAFFCSFTMIAAGIDDTNSITITLSCLGNVGPTLGLEIGPTMSWDELPIFAKWLCSFLLLVGRLELFTVLVLFTRTFWKEN